MEVTKADTRDLCAVSMRSTFSPFTQETEVKAAARWSKGPPHSHLVTSFQHIKLGGRDTKQATRTFSRRGEEVHPRLLRASRLGLTAVPSKDRRGTVTPRKVPMSPP